MFPRRLIALTFAGLVSALSAGDVVSTAVYARVGNGYQRARAKDGSFKPEYFALANGGRIGGTMWDNTVDRVSYREVATVALQFLAQQNYHYAQTKGQAKLLLMLQWGNTIAPNGTNYSLDVGAAGRAMADLKALMQGSGMEKSLLDQSHGADPMAQGDAAIIGDAKARMEMALLQLITDNRLRDQINESNARILGYRDDLAASSDIRRWAGGGDRYMDLITDVEESRYYIVISAYDFRDLTERNKRTLLWQTRVSVRSPGNRFDDSFAAMLKGAAKYFGQDSGRLIRGEESKGTVELGDLKILGEAKEPAPSNQEEPKR